MTKLDKPLRRVVTVAGGQEIVVELVPADEGIQAHLKLRLVNAKKSYFTMYIQPPATGPERQLAPGGSRV